MATITRENIGLLNDKITVKLAKNDYLPSFEKALKNYSKKANIPGFRKGMVPPGLIKKMYGSSVFTDEVLRTVEKELTQYMTTEQLDIFAQPLPLPENDASRIDMSSPDEYAFAFEVGLKPAFSISDPAKATLTHYKVEVTEEMIDEEVERHRVRHGKMTEPETVTGDENVLNLHFTETGPDGQPLEGGISKDNSLLVKYFKEDTRREWMGKKKDDFAVIRLSGAFEEKEREWVLGDLGLSKEDPAAADKYFKLLITKIGLVEKALQEPEFVGAVYPGKGITTESGFRDQVAAQIGQYWDTQSRNQLQHAIYHELLNHTRIDFPEAFLKRWMQNGSGGEPKTPETVENEFPSFANHLKWTLIADKIVRDNHLEVTADDIKAFARQQLLGYMGGQVVDEEQPWITDYVNRMMQDKKFVEETVQRIRTEKVFQWSETQVNPTEKQISREEFSKMQEEHKHTHHE
jgi:trigger factor